jgi:chromosome segregation ATPase
MNDEQRQRQMDFILEQQAQFTADIQHLKGLHAQAEKRTDRMERVVKLMIKAGLRARREMRAHDAHIKAHAEEIQTVDARISTLVDSQIETEAMTRRNSEAINQLAAIVQQLATKRNGDGTDGG